nr:heavy metal translocating P-type ATPase [Mycobacterium sp. MS1601]
MVFAESSTAQRVSRTSRWPATVWTIPSARWACAALLLFATGLALQLSGAPEPMWWAIYLACYAVGGWESARAGIQALRMRTLDVDLLMIVAAVGAASIGQVTDGALLIVIFATSGALEDLATARTEESVRALLDLAPDTAALDDGRLIPVSELSVGDIVRVRPGERISADGTVTSGSSDVDQASITGEPLPVSKTLGDSVFAGTLNGSGTLTIRVTEDPSQMVVARIVALVGEAAATKAKTQLFIEKVEQRYSLGVVVSTVALFAVPLANGSDLQSALLRAMTFMIVASPCALVLATMPPLLSAIANAGRHGVLVKSAVAMERLAGVTTVALDKTGTLTRGAPRLCTLEAFGHSEVDALRLAAAAEQHSEHPIGKAVLAAARERGIAVPAADEFEALTGRGVRARVNGRLVEVVNSSSGARSDGATVIMVVCDGVQIAVLSLHDDPRRDAFPAVAALRAELGTTPVLLTGDNTYAATTLAQKVGLDDIRAGLLPHQKADAVRTLETDGHRVLVVGDGINDAPAMAAAHTSIAMGRSGSDLALETADGVTVRDELIVIPTVISLARRARRVVIANLVIAGTFIVVLVTWDLVGHLPLPLGVAGHEGSTILVALNGLRLLSERAWRKAQVSSAIP